MGGGGVGADLEALGRAAGACIRCPLALTRTQVVFGQGARSARLFVVGEAPGQTEDAIGEPFAGPAGRRLRRALADAGADEADLYLTNTVLCHPPGAGALPDRPPNAEEVRACAPWLAAQLTAVNPVVVLTLGAVATRRVLGPRVALSAVRGRAHRVGRRTVVATFHPASLNRAPGRREQFLEDLRRAVVLSRGAPDRSQST